MRQFFINILRPLATVVLALSYTQADTLSPAQQHNAEFDISFDGLFPADSDENDDRKGMPDLDFLFEVGPQLIAHAAKYDFGSRGKAERIAGAKFPLDPISKEVHFMDKKDEKIHDHVHDAMKDLYGLESHEERLDALIKKHEEAQADEEREKIASLIEQEMKSIAGKQYP